MQFHHRVDGAPDKPVLVLSNSLGTDLGMWAPQLEALRAARSASLTWLRTVVDADWAIAHIHPKFGPLRAGDLLSAWAAHDLLHIRQLTKRRFELTARDAEPFSSRYAGDWGA